MYYYGGYQGSYNNSCGCAGSSNYAYPNYGYAAGYTGGYGYNAAIILVLFILLVIIIGTRGNI